MRHKYLDHECDIHTRCRVPHTNLDPGCGAYVDLDRAFTSGSSIRMRIEVLTLEVTFADQIFRYGPWIRRSGIMYRLWIPHTYLNVFSAFISRFGSGIYICIEDQDSHRCCGSAMSRAIISIWIRCSSGSMVPMYLCSGAFASPHLACPDEDRNR